MENLYTFIFTIGFMFCCGHQQGGTDVFPVIWTSYGAVKGQQFLSPWTNKTMYAFKGIPYASGPEGHMRFKDPVPAGKWPQVLDATKERAICPQVPTIFISPEAVQSEDCLFINVYTPQIPSMKRKLLPVIVFIPGGAFVRNSGDYYGNGPDFLVAEGIVFVSFNHRLGALGFLNLGIPGAPGNAGLKDQRLALLWVQSEIHNFGGDPNQVTLFGQSSGAMSVHHHYSSPLSIGLFHRAIANSGTSISMHDGVRADAGRYGLMLAERLNCSLGGGWRGYPRAQPSPSLPGTKPFYVPLEAANNAFKCLITADFKDIVMAQSQVTDTVGDITGLTVFGPTIDRYSSEEPFLPDFPFELLKEKNRFFVPFLSGINRDEGLVRLLSDEPSPEVIRNINNNYEYLFGLEAPQSCFGKRKVNKLKYFYNKYDGPSEPNVKKFVDVYTDIFFAYGTTVTARDYQNKDNFFLYFFSFNGTYKNPRIVAVEELYNYSGVAHNDELSYLFVIEFIDQTAPSYSNEVKTLRRMVKMWTNFAKYGTPTVGPDPLLQYVQWLPASKGRTNHLHIDVNLEMIPEDLLAPRAALWDSITFNHCFDTGGMQGFI